MSTFRARFIAPAIFAAFYPACSESLSSGDLDPSRSSMIVLAGVNASRCWRLLRSTGGSAAAAAAEGDRATAVPSVMAVGAN